METKSLLWDLVILSGQGACMLQCHGTTAVLLFSKLNEVFFGYFDPESFFYIVKINIFRSDLTDVSAKKDRLQQGPHRS